MHKIAKTRVLEIKDTSRVSCIVNPVYRGKYVNRFRFFLFYLLYKRLIILLRYNFQIDNFIAQNNTKSSIYEYEKKKKKKYRVLAVFLSNNHPVKIILTQFVSYVDKLQ